MRQRSPDVRRAGRIVLVIGLLLLAPGVVAFASSLAFVLHAQRVEAVFQGAVQHNSSYGLMYYPEFIFLTTDGRKMTFRSRIGSSDEEYSQGAKLTVLYDPDHPEHMEADTLFGVWLLPIVALPPALLVALIGIAILIL